MKRDRQKWIREIEESLEKVSKPGAHDRKYLLRLEQKLLDSTLVKRLPGRIVWSMAACFILLIAANVLLTLSYISNQSPKTLPADEYEIIMDSYGLFPMTLDNTLSL